MVCPSVRPERTRLLRDKRLLVLRVAAAVAAERVGALSVALSPCTLRDGSGLTEYIPAEGLGRGLWRRNSLFGARAVPGSGSVVKCKAGAWLSGGGQ